MDGLEFWSKGRVLTQGCRGAVGYHESRIQTTFSHQEGRQLAKGGVAEPFNSSFTNCGKFMDTNGQIVQGLKECLNQVGLYWNMGFPGGASGKEAATNAGDIRDAGLIPGREDPQMKEMATHHSILGWRIAWTEEPGRVQSMGSQRVGHD